MKLFYQCMTIFVNLSPSSSPLHPLQVENCGSDSRLVVDEDDNGKFRPERVKLFQYVTQIGFFSMWVPLTIYANPCIDTIHPTSYITTSTCTTAFNIINM